MRSIPSIQRSVKPNRIRVFISNRRSARRYRLRYSPSESKLRSREPPRHSLRAPCSQSEVSWELACRVPCTVSCQRVKHLQIKPRIIAFCAIRFREIRVSA
ncbi:hypothetical protein ALC57_09415 [Trachymyrmex cornetzi]|uniref:Uncharacterized protein n=1 Tax=Trachymyrmex cornetzi TaxID=471704 RepID=A0A195DZK8_9HYME|nr:hypothetical protein ALC57_09415 [Trachymyrmex cornetzi]